MAAFRRRDCYATAAAPPIDAIAAAILPPPLICRCLLSRLLPR